MVSLGGEMSSLMYFLGALVIAVGLLFMGGYIGTRNVDNMSRQVPLSVDGVIGHAAGSNGDCDTCKWY